MNTHQCEINGHKVTATFEVQDLREDDKNELGLVQVYTTLKIDGKSGFNLLLQNDGDGELCVGHVAELSAYDEYEKIRATLDLPTDDEAEEAYTVEHPNGPWPLFRVDITLEKGLKEIIAAAQKLFDSEVRFNNVSRTKHYQIHFATTPVAAANHFLKHHPEIDDTDDVALIRKTSARTGRKIWAMTETGLGVNCTVIEAKDAANWWQKEYDADAEGK